MSEFLYFDTIIHQASNSTVPWQAGLKPCESHATSSSLSANEYQLKLTCLKNDIADNEKQIWLKSH